MSDDDVVLIRIKKLFNIANNDAASEGEIRAAMHAAEALMNRHHLTEADLAHAPEDDYKKVDNAQFGRVNSWIGGKMYAWEGYLAHFVSGLVGCCHYIQNAKTWAKNINGLLKRNSAGEPICGKSFVWYGVHEDCVIAAELYDTLRLMISTLALAKFNSVYKGDGGSYAEGFVAGLRSQLKDSRDTEKRLAQQSVGSNSTALLVIARRDDLVEYKQKAAKSYLEKELKIKLASGTRRSGARGSEDAYGSGKRDGAATPVSVNRSKKLT